MYYRFFVGPTTLSNLRYNTLPLIFDGNVFVVSENGTIYNLKNDTIYPSEKLLWKLKLLNCKKMIASAFKFDFDKDGYDNFVIATEKWNILVAKNNIKKGI
jgi:hypothetical protein